MLDEAKVNYQEIDLTQDAEAMAMVKGLGYASAPVIVTSAGHWSGFRHSALLKAIELYRSDAMHDAA